MGKVAAIILSNKKEELLLYLRDDKSSIPHPNHWAILGGHLEEGENLNEAIRREVKEEINYNLEEITFLDDIDDLVGNRVYIFKSKINKKIKELDLTEGQRLGYFSFDEAMKLQIPKALRDFLVDNKYRIF